MGERQFRINPIYSIPASIYHVVRLWSRCQGGMGGLAHLPGPGSITDQPAWLMAAFAILDEAQADMAKDKP